MKVKRLLDIAVASAFLLAAPAAFAQDAAGKVLWVKGHAERVATNGSVHRLASGDTVAPGDVLRTGPDAHVQLAMEDDALFALRPDTTLRLEDYRYEGVEDGSERAVIEILKGGLRSITGAIGSTNKENVKLRTPTSLVGVRGTDHETFFIPQGNHAGTYDRVTQGATYIENAQGRVELDPGESGFAPLVGASPTRLERTPAFMRMASLRTGQPVGPQLREEAPGDERRLDKPRGAPHNEGAIPSGRRSLPEQASVPLLPAQALGGAGGQGWGRGGRCGGPCAERFTGAHLGLGNGAGNGKGNGKGGGKPF